MKLQLSQKEAFDLTKAWVALSIAFGILLSSRFGVFSSILVSFFTVGLAFLVHELAHKYVAIHYGAKAEFKADDTMLALAILMSFLGFIFAAPGAVMVRGFLTSRQNGLVSVAGPWSNVVLAILFFPLTFSSGFLGLIGYYGFFINSFIGLFNMIPVWMFDGAKVLRWNKPVYVITTLVLAFLTIGGFYL